MDLALRDRVAIVTAASRGLGRATAEALADEGVRTILCARTAEDLQRLSNRLPTESVAVTGDLLDPLVPQQLVSTALERFGRLDILVANTGGPGTGRAVDVKEDDLRGALESNLLVPVRLIQAALPAMMQQAWGRICVIASGSVKQPMTNLALSNAARPGLWGWAKTAATEIADDGVTLNLLCPGAHMTSRLHEVGASTDRRIGDPADFGKIVAFLCSPHTNYVTGTTVMVDGGRVMGL